MAVRLEFYISDEDMDRLWAIKEAQGKRELTGNEFARELLSAELHRLHPRKIENRTRRIKKAAIRRLSLFNFLSFVFVLLLLPVGVAIDTGGFIPCCFEYIGCATGFCGGYFSFFFKRSNNGFFFFIVK